MPYSVSRNPVPINKNKQGGKIPDASVNTKVVNAQSISSVDATGVKSNKTTNVASTRIATIVSKAISTNTKRTS